MEFDKRTEDNLATLLPAAREQARRFLRAVRAAGIDARIISGTRTFAEQDALFARGRTVPPLGKKYNVTNARGGFSNHNFGVAWDIGVFDAAGKYLSDSPLYAEAGKIGRDLGLEWGGDWDSFPDRPHFQARTGLTLTRMRELALAGKADQIPVLPLPGDEPKPTPKPDPKPTPPSAPPVKPAPRPVAVFLGAERLDGVKAFFEDSRVWVGLKGAVNRLGGGIVSASPATTAAPFTATVGLHGKRATITGKTVDGTVYVKFADLNALLGYGFTFDSKAARLSLTL